jgi:hypothetical protein
MLNEPCHIHSAFVDGKRVSRHAMKDCKTFLKLQEAAVNMIRGGPIFSASRWMLSRAMAKVMAMG